MPGDNHDQTARAWLSAWGDCVARADIDAARPLFSNDLIAFGTRAEIAVGLDAVVADQWSHVWSSIQGFHFDVDGARVYVSPDGLLAVVAATWTSEGRRVDQTIGHRPGRATVVLRRTRTDEPWRGVHTHFSLTPAVE